MIDPITGAKLWLAVKPIRRFKAWRNRRRERKGLPPLDESFEVEDVNMEGKKTYSGIAIMIVGFVLGWLGIGGEEDAMNLVAAGTELVGAIVAVYGRWAAKPK